MSITIFNGYLAAQKQKVQFLKTAAVTSVGAVGFTVFDKTGIPTPPANLTLAAGAGSGIVHTSATVGYPVINTFGSGNIGYISRIEVCSTVACTISLYDRVFVAGTYKFNDDVTLSGQPSFAARIPNLDYNGLEIWAENASAITTAQSVQIYYVNQDNVGNRTGGSVVVGGLTTNRMTLIPLQADDKGVKTINRAVMTGATVGTWNVMILRPLVKSIRLNNIGAKKVLDLTGTGMPIVYSDSALFCIVKTDLAVTGVPDMIIEIVNG